MTPGRGAARVGEAPAPVEEVERLVAVGAAEDRVLEPRAAEGARGGLEVLGAVLDQEDRLAGRARARYSLLRAA